MSPTPLLFISPRVPWPLNTGAKIRTHALLTALRGAYAVDYAGLLQPDLTPAAATAALAGCGTVELAPEPATTPGGKAWLGLRTLADRRPATVAKYDHPRLRAFVRAWAARHPGGVVHADHIHMAGYLGLAAGAGLTVIDEHNVEARILERLAEQRAGSPAAPYFGLQAARMRATEQRLTRGAGLVLAVSEGDADELRALAPRTPVELIRNGVDLDYFAPPAGGQRRPTPGRLVLTGSMNWLPNEDGALWFCKEVLPLLAAGGAPLAAVGAAPVAGASPWSFDIVGHAPPPAVQALAGEHVRVTGTVDDVRPYVHDAEIFVVPLRIGGGSRLKILEAFAMGIPVVSTTVGCEGLDAVDGRHLLIGDTPQALAAAVRRVQGDPALAAALTAAAGEHVRAHFSWPAIGARLVAAIERLRRGA